MRGDAGDVHGSRGDVDKEQDIVRNETLDRADLDAQEVRRRQTLPEEPSETSTIGCAHRAREVARSKNALIIGTSDRADTTCSKAFANAISVT
jgi:hypothetical protein